jgi:hypothetical protein
MVNYPRKVWQHVRDLLPLPAFHFDRPLVVFQSDDWGRVGLRDELGLEQLRSEGIELGEHPYDFYTLETADDVDALQNTLNRHRDSTGRQPCMEMNFVQANLDFRKMKADGFRQIHLLPLSDGLPEGWNRPGLFEAYRNGIAAGVFHPALHGTTHFCRRAVERHLSDSGPRGSLLRALWEAGTPYIYSRMPWIGYEYWDPEGPDDQFLSAGEQARLIGQAVGTFSRVFSTLPHSACAPGYRANEDTHKAWAEFGIRVAQNGPGTLTPPHLDRIQTLHLFRTVEFEPAADPQFSLEACLLRADACFRRRSPAIVSLHSINFHSSVKDFRSRTLTLLDEFLSALEANHPDLLYLHDHDLAQLVHKGQFETTHGTVRVNVTKSSSTRAALARGAEA